MVEVVVAEDHQRRNSCQLEKISQSSGLLKVVRDGVDSRNLDDARPERLLGPIVADEQDLHSLLPKDLQAGENCRSKSLAVCEFIDGRMEGTTFEATLLRCRVAEVSIAHLRGQ